MFGLPYLATEDSADITCMAAFRIGGCSKHHNWLRLNMNEHGCVPCEQLSKLGVTPENGKSSVPWSVSFCAHVLPSWMYSPLDVLTEPRPGPNLLLAERDNRKRLQKR